MLEFRTLDVFTTQPFTGNPLAVVLGADGLTTAQMQTIAREFNLSETIFVMAPRDPAHRARVRIFFPTAEIPFAGHPTIGCAILLASMDAGSGDFESHLVLEEEAGLVPVSVWRRAGVMEAEFTAPVVPHGTDGMVAEDRLAAALGLASGEIGFGAHRPGVWQGGPRFLYVPVASLAVLGRARAIQPHWDAVMAAARVDSAYLYTPGEECDFFAHGRHTRRPGHRICDGNSCGAVAWEWCFDGRHVVLSFAPRCGNGAGFGSVPVRRCRGRRSAGCANPGGGGGPVRRPHCSAEGVKAGRLAAAGNAAYSSRHVASDPARAQRPRPNPTA